MSVKASCTVATGGVEKRALGNRALLQPTVRRENGALEWMNGHLAGNPSGYTR